MVAGTTPAAICRCSTPAGPGIAAACAHDPGTFRRLQPRDKASPVMHDFEMVLAPHICQACQTTLTGSAATGWVALMASPASAWLGSPASCCDAGCWLPTDADRAGCGGAACCGGSACRCGAGSGVWCGGSC